MNKLLLYLFLILALPGLCGCQEKVKDPVITSLQLSLSKSKILGDNNDYATVTVTDQAGKNVLQLVSVYYAGQKISGDKIKSATPSVTAVYAEYGSVKSNEVQVEVVEDKNLKFSKNVLIEQYTGTWCGWCPRAIYQINNLQNTDQKTVHAAYHLSDAMSYSLNNSLFQSFGFTGIPTVHADRNVVWSGDAAAIGYMHAPARVGISLEVTGTSSKVTASVSVKFGIDFTDDLALSVYLLHDSLTADQTNYYNTDPSSF